MREINNLFVYGTLGPNGPNAHILKKIGGEYKSAFVRGVLYPMGWGATLGYPAIVLDPKAKRIRGHVFKSENLLTHWSDLDDFEGEGYKRVVTRVDLEDGATTEAYIYELRIKD